MRHAGILLPILLAIVPVLLAGEASPPPADPPPADTPVIRYVEFEDTVNRITAGRLIEEIDTADRNGETLVLVRLDTPGGYVTNLEEIVKRIFASRTPVVMWVGPSGAKAMSAGFIMLIASDVAAMAPGTSTGAAAVVAVTGGDDKGESTPMKKASEAMAASARSYAEQRNRNPEACESAVKEAKAWSNSEAIKKGIVDLVAKDRKDLLQQLDGREIRRFDGTTTILRTSGARFVTTDRSFRLDILGWLADPTIAYFLLMAGLAALYMEFSNPGLIIPGAIGALCLLLFAFSISLLPVSTVGIALIIIAIVLFVMEIKVTSYGLLTIGGLVCLVIGSMMLYDGPTPDMRLPLGIVLPTSLVVAGSCYFALRLSVQAHKAKVATGIEGLVGETGEVSVDLAPRGKVFVHGEIWDAVASGDAPLAKGTAVRVVRLEKLRLIVEPVTAPDPGPLGSSA
jgi:membrane-bound serine protease (ClpP class)